MKTIIPITLSEFSKDSQNWKDFYGIFRDTIYPELTMREFKFFYHFQKIKHISVDFIYAEDRLVGFIAAAFYRTVCDEQGGCKTIARGTAGILPEYRGGMMPSFRLCLKYIDYKFRHPFEQVYITGYMANPKLYSMMCRYAHRVYPKVNITEPEEIGHLRNFILSGKHRRDEYLVRLHFPVSITEKEQLQIERNTDEHTKYFLHLNPDYRQQVGLFTIIPVDAGNIIHSVAIQVVKFTSNRCKLLHQLLKPAPASKKSLVNV